MGEKLNKRIETENDGLHCSGVQFLPRENFERVTFQKLRHT